VCGCGVVEDVGIIEDFAGCVDTLSVLEVTEAV
jgi:hypothetical protein